MSRNKIDYGIDLGTTNSAIARMERGESRILKLENSKEVLPSCVGFNKKGDVRVGERALNGLRQESALWESGKGVKFNHFIEFKRTMGTDALYSSENAGKELNSEELSAEVVKKLRSFVNDDTLETAVVTVPAQFDIKQKEATKRAAEIAGLSHCELLQEPIAACSAYGAGQEGKEGHWLVFDFGGGTFDTALVKNDGGLLKVVDTEGDNRLGGKNLDQAVVEEILIPHFKERFSIDGILSDENISGYFKFWLKGFAEEIKVQLSFQEEYQMFYEDFMLGEKTDDEGEMLDIDLKVSRLNLKEVVAPLYQKGIDLSKELLKRNNLQGEDLSSVLLVGGSTASPILHEMLEDQLKAPNTDIDPMTAVAKGAALYASTVDLPDEVQDRSRDKGKVQLKVGYEATSVEEEEPVTIKTLPEKSEGEVPSTVFAEIEREDKGWKSDRLKVDEKGDLVEVKLMAGEPNRFQIQVFDEQGTPLDCEPDAFTITQGTKVGAASLPHGIGIEIKRKEEDRSEFSVIEGLEKNKSLPATGTYNGLKTQMDIRPGKNEDRLRIPIYQGGYDSEGTRAIYNELLYNIELTGEDLPQFLPEGSDVDLTLRVDNSGRPEKIELFIPYLDESVEKAIPEEKSSISQEFLEKEVSKAEKEASGLKDRSGVDTNEVQGLESKIGGLREQLKKVDPKDEDEKARIMGELKESFRRMDHMMEGTEWDQLEKELQDEFSRLEKAQSELGDEKSGKEVEQLREKMNQVLKQKDPKMGRKLKEEIKDLFVQLTFLYQLMGFVENVRDNFDQYRWKDPDQARNLVSKAEKEMNNNPTVQNLHPIVKDIVDLIPEEEKRSEEQELLMK